MNDEQFIRELMKWNKVHHMTNYKTQKEIRKQIEDSLYPVEKLKGAQKIIDIGTGAGFPGLILAMELKETDFYLVEPLQKRFSFLNYVKTLLGLSNVTVVPKRIEEVEAFDADWIISRAVTDTKKLIELTVHFRKFNVNYLLYKGSRVYDEIEGMCTEIIQNGERHYVIVKDKV